MNKYKAILENSGIFAKILILTGSFFFFGILSILSWKILSGENTATISATKSLQTFTQIGAFLIPSLLIAYLCSNQPTNYLHANKQPKLIPALAVIVFMIIIIPFINLLGFFNQQIVLPESLKWIEEQLKANEFQATQATKQLLNVNNINGLLINTFVIALLPAITEELFFRGALQSIFSNKKNYITAIWMTAFVFSSIHFQFYGFLPRLILGAFLGYLLFWSENIWLPIIGHFTNNLVAVLFYYLLNTGFKMPAIDTIGTGDTLWIGFASGVLGLVGVFQLKKYFKIKSTSSSFANNH